MLLVCILSQLSVESQLSVRRAGANPSSVRLLEEALHFVHLALAHELQDLGDPFWRLVDHGQSVKTRFDLISMQVPFQTFQPPVVLVILCELRV